MSIASQPNTEFTCPKCGSHRWKSQGACDGKIFPTLELPMMYHTCDFTWDRSDDAKYFGPIIFKIGDMVRTADNLELRDFSEQAIRNRKCSTHGIVIGSHDSHGICYDVDHFGTVGSYDTDELTRVPVQVRWTGVL